MCDRDKGGQALVRLKGKRGKPDDEHPIKMVTTTAPLLGSDTDVDVDSESDEDEGDSSILLENDDWIQVSGHPPLFVYINLPVYGAGRYRSTADGTGYELRLEERLASADEVHRYFIRRRAALVELPSII